MSKNMFKAGKILLYTQVIVFTTSVSIKMFNISSIFLASSN